MMSKTEDQEELTGEKIRVTVSIEVGSPEENRIFGEKLIELLQIVEIVPFCEATHLGGPHNFILDMNSWVRLVEAFPILELLEAFPKFCFYIVWPKPPNDEFDEAKHIEGRTFFVSSIEDLVKLLE